MRVLIISHTVFSNTESMGKTLSNYFCEFDSNELAQFYIHPQAPISSICHRYYRFTDRDAIMSIFHLKKGISFSTNEQKDSCNDIHMTDFTKSIYQKGRKRTPFVYFIRNIIWRLSNWNNKKFKKWIDDFDPECVFFASGDYSFMYRIALKIAKSKNIPLYISCMDDYYLNNKNDNSTFGRAVHNRFMSIVKKTVDYSNAMFCICEKMSEDYGKYFNKKCYTLHTPASFIGPLNTLKKNKICYLGSLGYKRDDQLVEIGCTLKKIGLHPNHIDVYSSEKRRNILEKLTLENGILFHGEIGSSEVINVIGESMAVLHVESFNESTRRSIKYSVSTKIADSLESGTCIFAYGPQEVASISYLHDNDAAICCFKRDSLELYLRELIIRSDERERKIINARQLANRNHRIDSASMLLKKVLMSDS